VEDHSLVHYATDIEQFMGKGDIRKEFFAAPFPVTTTVQVMRLYHTDLLIEITAMAEIPRAALSSLARLMQPAPCPLERVWCR
jgi:2-iminobutanoate/2-iminopropanoate deaminase